MEHLTPPKSEIHVYWKTFITLKLLAWLKKFLYNDGNTLNPIRTWGCHIDAPLRVLMLNISEMLQPISTNLVLFKIIIYIRSSFEIKNLRIGHSLLPMVTG